MTRPTLPPEGETKALMDAMDDEALAFLTACVAFAKFMQTDVEFGLAYDILKSFTSEVYNRKEYYESQVNPLTGKLIVKPPPPSPAINWEEVMSRVRP